MHAATYTKVGHTLEYRALLLRPLRPPRPLQTQLDEPQLAPHTCESKDQSRHRRECQKVFKQCDQASHDIRRKWISNRGSPYDLFNSSKDKPDRSAVAKSRTMAFTAEPGGGNLSGGFNSPDALPLPQRSGRGPEPAAPRASISAAAAKSDGRANRHMGPNPTLSPERGGGWRLPKRGIRTLSAEREEPNP